MILDYAQFRQRFPEFADTAKFPDTTLEIFWIMAGDFMDSTDSPCRILSGDKLVLARQYLTAHLLSIATNQKNDAANGGGADQGGFVTGATIGDITVNKLAPPVKDGWEYWLSGTPYGSALWALLKLLAVGGIALGGLPERDAFRKVDGTFW